MAKVDGILKFRGTIDNITFVRGKNGAYFARKKRKPVPKQVLLKSEKYKATRECFMEFGSASKAGRLFREAIKELLILTKDSRLNTRLNGKFIKVLQSDLLHKRGKRKVGNGDLEIIRNFELNGDAHLAYICRILYDASRSGENIQLSIKPFNPLQLFKAPKGATHFMLHTLCCEIDFDEGKFHTKTNHTELFSYSDGIIPGFSLEHKLTGNGNLPAFLLLGITFFTDVSGGYHPLHNTSFNALKVVGVFNGGSGKDGKRARVRQL